VNTPTLCQAFPAPYLDWIRSHIYRRQRAEHVSYHEPRGRCSARLPTAEFDDTAVIMHSLLDRHRSRPRRFCGVRVHQRSGEVRELHIRTAEHGYGVDCYYDPATGQFLSVGPLVSQTQQPYIYAGDDPVNESDPSGRYVSGPPGNGCATGVSGTWCTSSSGPVQKATPCQLPITNPGASSYPGYGSPVDNPALAPLINEAVYVLEGHFSDVVTAAIIGNLVVESGGTLNPMELQHIPGCATHKQAESNRGDCGEGIAQWTVGGTYDRWNTGLAAWAGPNVYCYYSQLQYIYVESTAPDNGYLGYSTWSTDTSIDQATTDFGMLYERPEDLADSITDRKNDAEYVYTNFIA